MTTHLSFCKMLLQEIGVSSNLVSYGKGNPARFLETVILCEAFRGNLETGSSLCYHTISVHTCFCVCICLIFRSAYLAYCCICAILFSVSHSNIMNIFCCLCYMPGVYLNLPCYVCVVFLVFYSPKLVR